MQGVVGYCGAEDPIQVGWGGDLSKVQKGPEFLDKPGLSHKLQLNAILKNIPTKMGRSGTGNHPFQFWRDQNFEHFPMGLGTPKVGIPYSKVYNFLKY